MDWVELLKWDGKFTKDLYFMAGITISYVFRGKGMDCPNF
jgi:hypothetical protein